MWYRELQKHCVERSRSRVDGTFSTGRVAGDHISKSSRCLQRDKGGEHILLTCRSGIMQGDPQVREGRRGSTAPQGGAGGVLPAQLFQSPLISVPRNDSLQGARGKRPSIWVPEMQLTSVVYCVFRPPLFSRGSGHACTRKHKGFGFDQFQ